GEEPGQPPAAALARAVGAVIHQTGESGVPEPGELVGQNLSGDAYGRGKRPKRSRIEGHLSSLSNDIKSRVAGLRQAGVDWVTSP
ncbi:MAG: hypothetical protein QME55_10920, partial [Brevundimonas sp.]|uniref:hypothetical protein n=1 Tax=Brevundimonas sp. TaxID=1871086 RepID=UPI002624A9B4